MTAYRKRQYILCDLQRSCRTALVQQLLAFLIKLRKRLSYTRILPSASAVFVAATIPSIKAIMAGITVQKNKR